jgi:hypothetical protein
MTKWRMRIACWITKATNTPSGMNVILIDLRRQRCLYERASFVKVYLRMYNVCLDELVDRAS